MYIYIYIYIRPGAVSKALTMAKLSWPTILSPSPFEQDYIKSETLALSLATAATIGDGEAIELPGEVKLQISVQKATL